MLRHTLVLLAVFGACMMRLNGREQPLVLADFTRPSGWNPAHATTNATQSAEGLSFAVAGDDPWVLGPQQSFPKVPTGTKRIRFTLTCAPVKDAETWQLFYSFGGRPYGQGESCWLKPVGTSPYTRYEAEIPVGEITSELCSFRIDPPSTLRSWTLQSFSCEFLSPLWTLMPCPQHPFVIPAATSLVLRGEEWELRHDPDRLGAFRFLSRGKTVENRPEEPFAYLDKSGNVRTLDWSEAKMAVEVADGRITTFARLTDADGIGWCLTRRFLPQDEGRALSVATEISCAAEVRILHMPFLTLFVDRASQGRKHQAMLAGVEYLDDEPSSNEKEIRTSEHNRLIPTEYRLSAPLAIWSDERNWLAAVWNQMADGSYLKDVSAGPHAAAAVFDSPDRLFASGGHMLGFWAPAVGEARRESELDVYAPTCFKSGSHIVMLRTGVGSTVAAALEGVLPARPQSLPPTDEVSATATLESLARGWLDSDIRNGDYVRHAVPFTWQLVSDAPVLMRYLAAELRRRPEADSTLAPRLRKVADEMLTKIPRTEIGHSGVSHIRHPVAVLVADGDLAGWLNGRLTRQRELNRALASGKRLWVRPQKGPDFGETLGADHCNGYTAMELDSLLSAAVWSGDEGEIEKTLSIVDKVTALYRGTVPRGAQPWEMPLHTPDIVASARLVRSYALANLLRPNPAYVQQAHEWAYTGLSMTYLVQAPIAREDGELPVGRYATCGVMGATHWAKPNWIGRPVQWCGLVYADALWELSRIENGDAAAFWRKIATGITTSGVRQNHTADEPKLIGLLPDSWDLTEQSRYAVPINPGTVQENYAECLGRPYYAVRRLAGGSLIHVPGNAENLSDKVPRCRIEGWPEAPFKVVITRVAEPATVTFDGRPVESRYEAAFRALIVTLPARACGELALR